MYIGGYQNWFLKNQKFSISSNFFRQLIEHFIWYRHVNFQLYTLNKSRVLTKMNLDRSRGRKSTVLDKT